jgi:Cu+-exporting ATPase
VARDPVCDMNVRETDAKYTSKYEDKKFFFCSSACKRNFDENPEDYIT